MNKELSSFAARLREIIVVGDDVRSLTSDKFSELALELFANQFTYNAAYRKICERRKLTPNVVEHWTQIPFVPTSAFKELELTSIAPGERVAIFHSSGTTEQMTSRHFHSLESLWLYEVSLKAGFNRSILENPQSAIRNPQLICLTPPPERVPHSSLVHMFETVRQKLGAPQSAFVGKLEADDSWTLDFDAFSMSLSPERGSVTRSSHDHSKMLRLTEPRSDSISRFRLPRPETLDPRPHLLLGTAFSFVHLLDYLAETNSRLSLPEGSRVMETGGYKNRSRSLPKTELHALITKFLGVPPQNIICEYGMSELSSQAYDYGARVCEPQQLGNERIAAGHRPALRLFRFPPWARAQIISPETGREVANGETGLIRIFDLANVFSVSAIQTEDLGIRRSDGFELIGRAKLAEPRGCSLTAA